MAILSYFYLKTAQNSHPQNGHLAILGQQVWPV
jgi:hypothetical protein